MTPAFSVTANGADISAALEQRLISLRISDEISQEAGAARGTSHTCDIELDDRDASIALPSMGALLTIAMGYKETDLAKMGTFRVDELELEGPERRLVIRGRAADTNSATSVGQLMGRKTRSWEPSTIGAIAYLIAAEHGWDASVDGTIAATPTKHLDQTAQSDMDFLKTVVAEAQPDAYCTLAGGKIVISRIASGKTASGKPVSTVAVAATDALSWNATVTVRGKHQKVAARWHNQATGETVTEVVGDDSGDDAESYSETELPMTFPDAATARAAASAKQAALGRGSETVSVTIVGNPRVAAGGHVVLSGFRSGIDRTWIVTRAEHQISARGFTTSIDGQKL